MFPDAYKEAADHYRAETTSENVRCRDLRSAQARTFLLRCFGGGCPPYRRSPELLAALKALFKVAPPGGDITHAEEHKRYGEALAAAAAAIAKAEGRAQKP
jgi:hypothetical protein